jgi:hypothetical protein
MDLKREEENIVNGSSHQGNFQTDQLLADAFDENYDHDDQNENPEANSDKDAAA